MVVSRKSRQDHETPKEAKSGGVNPRLTTTAVKLIRGTLLFAIAKVQAKADTLAEQHNQGTRHCEGESDYAASCP